MYEFPRVRWIRSQDFGPRSTETTAEELGTGGGGGTRNGRRRNERNESPGRDGSRPRSATPRWPEGRRREAETRRDEEGGMPGLGTLLGEGAASRRPGAGIGKSERVLGSAAAVGSGGWGWGGRSVVCVGGGGDADRGEPVGAKPERQSAVWARAVRRIGCGRGGSGME
ncbi:hypothetical protein PVAP13_3KG100027 [Panicum virgatum]|uniref:Uncharacterized protein n=1 Tax=Panicum virgatum TaxID=38727 RepID=A0A8T0UT63_PANVG|nr:hypothetical protein PVAP13_3KG100027 [Panicum virgatum]